MWRFTVRPLRLHMQLKFCEVQLKFSLVALVRLTFSWSVCVCSQGPKLTPTKPQMGEDFKFGR